MGGYNDAMQGNMAAALGRRTPAATAPADAGPKPHEGRGKLTGACSIELERIVRDPDQPRTEFDEADIASLAESLKTRGQLQPARVRWDQGLGKYVIILGERRFRAAKEAGLHSLACVVVEDAVTPEDRLEDQIIENMLRADLKPIEQARSYRRLMDAKGYNHAELADRLKIKRESVTQALQLLILPAPVQEAVDAGKISPTTGYEIAKVADPAEQERIADAVVAGHLNRADVRERVARTATANKGQGGRGKGKPKAVKLPTEAKFRAPNGIRVVAERRKGFSPAEWIEALEATVEHARASMVEQGGSAEDRAAEAA